MQEKIGSLTLALGTFFFVKILHSTQMKTFSFTRMTYINPSILVGPDGPSSGFINVSQGDPDISPKYNVQYLFLHLHL